jgi:alpha-glucosidase
MSSDTNHKSSQPESWSVASTSACSVVLRSAHAVGQITVLERDVFRVRFARGRRLNRQPSWSVLAQDWPEPDVRWRFGRKTSSATTAAGQFKLNLRTGRWSLSDDGGNELFAGSGLNLSDAKPCFELALTPDERLFGLGESTGTFNKRGLIREFWNLDVLGHAPAIHPGLRSLYVSIPFAVSLRGGLAAGLFWDNPARQVWDMGATRFDRWQLAADSGEVDLYLIVGPSVERVVGRFAELTGHAASLPDWAFGYHQCRYSYETRERVEQVAATFRRKRIPCDALYLDIHHLDGYRVFTFGKTFPKPKELIHRLARKGFKTMCIVDPGVKNDPRFGVLQRGRKHDAFVKDASGRKDFPGRVWPGESRFPDFMNPAVRRWWGDEQRKLSRLGVAGFWNDMNEPANFARPDKTLDPRARHVTDHGPRRHAEVHNLYGREMARASHEGALAAEPGQRPVIITRAGWAGVQRHAIVWTGDNSSTWQHFEDSLQTLLNLGLSGVPFCGCDAGGFLDNCTPELFIRWMQCAAFTPFFRGHTNTGTIDHEPWSFGPAAEAITRHYIQLRYQLLPYFRALADEAVRTGAPLMRPLFWHHQDDPVAADLGDQFLLGRNLLVAPVIRQGAVARSVYLPAGDWFEFWSGERLAGGRHVIASAPLEILPLYARAGALLPFRDVQQSVGEKPLREVLLHLWPGGMDSLHWREDDGVSNSIADCCERTVLASSSEAGGRLVIDQTRGPRRSTVKTWRVVVRGAGRKLKVKVNGRAVASVFDRASGIVTWEVPNARAVIQIEWR